MITDSGKFGIEYNYGSKDWTPFTWAEDTMIGSKLSVRGHATEVYWNTNLGGLKNLTAQVRYTNIQHDYTPNQKCQGWIKPEAVDIQAQNISFSLRYKAFLKNFLQAVLTPLNLLMWVIKRLALTANKKLSGVC